MRQEGKWKRKIALFILWAACMHIALSGVSAQDNGYDCFQSYEDVLNTLFLDTHREPRYDGYLIELQYRSQSFPETKIAIVQSSSAKYKVYFYEPKDGHIGRRLSEICGKNKRTTFSDLIKQLPVVRSEVELSRAEVKSIREGFYKLLPQLSAAEQERLGRELDRRVSNISTDGMLYVALYAGGQTIHLTDEGSSLNGKESPTDSALVRWMRDVYRIVTQRRTSKPASILHP